MCVDDYQFRHHSAVREKLCKRFIFHTPEGMTRVYLVNISQFQVFGNLCLCQILMHLNKKGLNIKDYRFYLPKFDVTIEAGDRCQVPFEFFIEKEVVFEMKLIDDEKLQHYRRLYRTCKEQQCLIQKQEERMQEEKKLIPCSTCPQMIAENSSEEQHSEEEYSPYNNTGQSYREDGTKKNKQAEKTVQEALRRTKHWRWIHEKLNFSLKNAANFVGISKKTLDDYFLILRVGQFHCYDFKSNLDKRIGHLRAFIKNQPIRIRGRLPKVLGAFDFVEDPDLSPITQMMAARLTKDEHVEVVATSSTFSTHSQKAKADENQMVAE